MINYIFNNREGILFHGKKESITISTAVIKKALEATNEKMELLKRDAPDVFEILGMRNLSAFVGEMFVSSLKNVSNGLLIKNPHQDGYPDLLVMTQDGKDLWKKLKDNHQDKSPFSDFETGGIEVKSTCGSLPTPAHFRKKGLLKPSIGDERINYVRGYDWKAHHRQTNNLIGVFWDFVQDKPTICGLFYGEDLSLDDWGKIVQPKQGGGRTTSVSIMTKEGIYKMYNNWIAVIDDKRYMEFFDRFNKSTVIADFVSGKTPDHSERLAYVSK